MGTQIIGSSETAIAEVESATKALRTTLRPIDYKTLGSYSLSGNSGTMAAALTTAQRIWSFRWGNTAGNLCLVTSITFSAAILAAATAAGIAQFNLFNARNFRTSDSSGGTELAPAAGKNKLRASMGSSLLSSCYIAATGVISGAGTAAAMGADGDPVSTLMGGLAASGNAGVKIIPPMTFFDQRPGEFPWVLAQDEGLFIQTGGAAAMPATMTWVFGVTVRWTEIATYP